MARFVSKCANQVLCMKPSRVQIIDGITMPVEGAHIRFVNGECITTDKAEIDYIKKHRLYGSQIVEVKKADTEQNAE